MHLDLLLQSRYQTFQLRGELRIDLIISDLWRYPLGDVDCFAQNVPVFLSPAALVNQTLRFQNLEFQSPSFTDASSVSSWKIP